MSLSDIFTSSVVISLAISLLLIGLLGLYVNNKFNEQNHKLNTMFDLVSTLAGELQVVRGHLGDSMGSISIGGGNQPLANQAANKNHLVNINPMIDVSDDNSENDSDEDSETSDDESDNDDSARESDDDNDAESLNESDDEESQDDAKSDKAIVVSAESLEETHFEELDNLDELVLDDSKDVPINITDTKPTDSLLNVKNVNVVFDYKKASITKLREIVEEKGLASDTGKLKKHELLKLLDVE
jgi:hypothetical protein